MKKKNWRSWHKWLGIIFCFFMLMFCVSGIVLNHRHMYGKVNVSRRYLPQSYQYTNWNNGLMRGTIPLLFPKGGEMYSERKQTGNYQACHSPLGETERALLLYGAGGIYLTDSLGRNYKDFNMGMPESADSRNIRAVVQMPDGTLFALAPYDLYRIVHLEWSRIPLGSQSKVEPTRFTDLTTRGDTLVVLSRSHVYVSLPPYRDFKRYELKSPENHDGKVTLFRTIWMIHSGEILGVPGKVFMDLMGLLFIFLSLTGIIIWLCPKINKFYKKHKHSSDSSPFGKLGGASLKYHNLLGRYTIIFTLFVAVTGWMLRPPVLIALVKNVTKPIPFSRLDSNNAWEDKLRMIRWDDAQGDWLISTSEGFYSLASFDQTPQRVDDAPPVSVMGLNVFKHKDVSDESADVYLIGSFAGMFIWNRTTGEAYDYFTSLPAPKTAGAPFGNIAVAGYSDDFSCPPVVNTYYEGNDLIPQPAEFRNLPISVWSLALEVHTGRIYTFMCGAETLIYIFIAGIIVVLILWSGWKIRMKK